MKIEKGKIFNVKELKQSKISAEIISKDPSVSILKIDDKSYIIKRIGSCDYKKCGSACCKFVHINTRNSFADNFLEKADTGYIIKKNCKHLKQSGKCAIWQHKKWPNSCKNFPLLLDQHYAQIHHKCTIKFEVVGELL